MCKLAVILNKHMKKKILIMLILTLTSCSSIFLNMALDKVGVFEEKADLKMISNGKQNIVFIEIQLSLRMCSINTEW